MAIVVTTIKASGGDYSSVTAWEADLDNTTPYDAGDEAHGEVFDFISEAAEVDINGGTTIGLVRVNLIGEATSRHDGTATGVDAGIDYTGSGDENIIIHDAEDISGNVQWLELDGNDDDPASGIQWEKGQAGGNNTNHICSNNIIHDFQGVKVRHAIFNQNRSFSGFNMYITNNIAYNMQATAQSTAAGIRCINTGAIDNIFNNTLFNITMTHATRNVEGIETIDDADKTIKNNLAIQVTVSGSGTGSCYLPSMELSTGDSDNNGSSDATGSSGLTSLGTSEFVSTTPGSEDLHLASGSTSEDAGVDLGSGVNAHIDINGEDRTTITNWDIGAHEFELPAAPAGGIEVLRRRIEAHA